MADDTQQEIIQALDELLDLERAALVEGQLEHLPRMTIEKEKLVERINTLPAVKQADIETVQIKVNRNQALLKSALDGIRAVANRMAEMRRVRQGLETYDHAGHRQRHPTRGTPKLEKRA